MTPSNPDNQQPLIYRIADALGVFHLVAPVNHTHSQAEIDGLATALAGKSNTDHTHDHIILAGVGRMGVSEDEETRDGYVWVVLWDDAQEAEVTYLIKKDDLLKWLNPDSTPTDNSTKFVTSGGVKIALDGKASVADVAFTSFSREATEQLNLHTLFEDGHTQSTIRLYNIGVEPFSLSDFLTARAGDDILFQIGAIPTIDPDQFAIVRIIVKHEGDYDEFYVICDGIFTY